MTHLLLPPHLDLVDMAKLAVGDINAMITESTARHGDIVRFSYNGRTVYALIHPAHIERVMVATERDFVKGDIGKDRGMITDFLLGNGLVTSDGDVWRRQRRLAQPAFHRERVAHYGETMIAYAQRMVDGWHAGEQHEIGAAMRRVTLAIVAKTLFDADIETSGEAAQMSAAFEIVLDEYARGNDALAGWRGALHSTRRQRYDHATATLDAAVQALIGRRRASGDRGDLLSMLIAAQDVDGSHMTDAQLRDEVMTLVVAGHDTTSATLTWALYLLSQHPDALAALRDELHTVVGERDLLVSDVAHLALLNATVKETLRLYPPIPELAREAAVDTTLGGFAVPKGTVLLLSPWCVQRDARWYHNPTRFQPERWLDGLEQRNPKYALFPFGGGPRLCIGNSFATLEATLVLGEIVRRFTLTPVAGQRIEPDMRTMRPKHGLWMTVA